jgi:flagellar hook-associated protein 3 FlgL
MAGFYPVPSTRSTQLLAQNRLLQQLHADQLAVQRLQTQISTGQRISRPGEDAAAAQRGQTLQRLIELKTQAKTNTQTAQSYLNATDTALANVAQLLTDIRALAVEAANDGSTDANRQAIAQQTAEAIDELLGVANENFRDRYLFAGSRQEILPFDRTNGGVLYQGNEGSLDSFVDLGLGLETNASGTAVFGTYSSQVQGRIDLNPALTADTPISSLAGGNGLTLGSIQIGDGTTKSIIDLSSAATIQDIVELIEANPPEGRTLTVTITATGLTVAIDAAGGGNLTIKDVAGGTTASDLRIATPLLGVGIAPVVGGDLNPAIRLTTQLSTLQTALPLDLAVGLQITNAGQTFVIDTSSAQTVEQLLNAINQSPANVLAEIAPAGDRLVVRSRLSGSDFSIGENGGTLATQLGIRSLDLDTALADLNYGRGVATLTGTDFTIHRKDGTDLAVDVSSAVTIGDVLNLINNDPANLDPATRVMARLTAFGNGIELFDGNTTGADTLTVTRRFGSDAVYDLGLVARPQTVATATSGGSGDTLTGSDPNPQQVSGLFNSMLRLHDSLKNFNRENLSRAVELLDEDFERLNLARSEVGARNQTVDSVKAQLEDEEIELRSTLADAIETTLPQAISDLAARQAALQASLQLAAQVFRTSLLDFL